MRAKMWVVAIGLKRAHNDAAVVFQPSMLGKVS